MPLAPGPTAHCPLPTAHCPLPTAHCPLSTAHCSLPTTTAHCSLLPTAHHCPLLTAFCSRCAIGSGLTRGQPYGPSLTRSQSTREIWRRSTQITVATHVQNKAERKAQPTWPMGRGRPKLGAACSAAETPCPAAETPCPAARPDAERRLEGPGLEGPGVEGPGVEGRSRALPL